MTLAGVDIFIRIEHPNPRGTHPTLCGVYLFKCLDKHSVEFLVFKLQAEKTNSTDKNQYLELL